MVKNTRRVQRGEDALSRERIVDAAIAILDADGDAGLTFRVLAQRLGTGAGAIYWHVANKDDLVLAACDDVVGRALRSVDAGETPAVDVRAIALAMFDALDVHPWIGTALTRAAGAMPTVRLLERLGRQVLALGVPADGAWTATSALLSYILGVSGQNAANAQHARAVGLERGPFLDAIASAWSALDPEAFPFTRGVAGRLRTHDDRTDFLAGIDLLLAGLAARHGMGHAAARRGA